MKVFRNIADAILYGNVFVSICAYFLTLQNPYFEGLAGFSDPVALFVFFSTLFIYNYRKFLFAKRDFGEKASPRAYWVSGNRPILGLLCLIALAGVVYELAQLSKLTIYCLIPCFIVSIGYASNLLFTNSTKKKLRQIPYLKIFLVAGVWSFVTNILPLIEISGFQQQLVKVGFLFLERFLFIFAITIPFDIRDMELDKRSGIKTIPLLLGDRKAIQLSVFTLAILLLLQLGSLIFIKQVNYAIISGTGLNAIFSAFLVSKSSQKSSDYYVSFFVEGLMLTQFILIFLIDFIFRVF